MRRIIGFVFVLISLHAVSQKQDSVADEEKKNAVPRDTVAYDSTLNQAKIVDSIATPQQPRGDVETTINYNAEDSLFFDIANKNLYLYGNTHIDYGSISLEAERTSVYWETNEISATYLTDTTGKKIGKPVFKEGSDVYETENIVYNFKSKRALIKGVITEQEGGFMHGENVKKNEDNELFIQGAKYTTCNLENPHFHIESNKIKVIPGNKVVAGPFNMKFGDLQTPLFLPFGMFPQPKKKSSGIVFPSYGEEQRRGFFLRDGGYYFAISDYADLRITGTIYSKGGNAINTTSNYFKRYMYRGTFNFTYTATPDLNNPESETLTRDYWIRWNHSPETRGNSSISASVSAGTSTYTTNNNTVVQDFNRSINATFTSNISYSKKFQGTPFSMSANLRHNQNLLTEIVTLTLPDVTFNTARIYPLKAFTKSNNSPLTKLSLSHNMVLKNELSNARISVPGYVIGGEGLSDTLAFNANNLSKILDRSKRGIRHTVPISTSVNLLKYFTLNPNFNLTDIWYDRELRYTYDEELNGVKVDTLQGFSRAGSWSSGASLNTRIYGTVAFAKGKIQAVRHVMTPSISFAYNPNFSDPRFGVFTEVQTDTTAAGDPVFTTLSKYQGFVYGSPGGSESQSLGFNLTNQLEMKIADKRDTVKGYRKVKIFENLGFGSGYNFAADSFKLSNISVNARTSLLNGALGVNFTGTIDPYIYDPENNQRIEKFAWNNGRGLGQLTSASLALSLRLSPDFAKQKGTEDSGETDDFNKSGFDAPTENSDFRGLTKKEAEELEYLENNPNQYINFDIPWSLNVNYSVARRQRGFETPNTNQNMTFNGSVGLTKKTQITFNSGFDFQAKDFTTTRIGVTRDLHCWTMDFNWVPFGPQQSYFVSIRAKSAILQDLKVEKRRSFLDFFN